jgi:hypothetical protein
MSKIPTIALGKLEKCGLRSRTVSVQHLAELQNDIEKLRRQGDLILRGLLLRI